MLVQYRNMQNATTTINFQELLVSLLSKLSEREQEILKRRYHLTSDLEKKSTLKQIGDFYSITRERVTQIEKEAIRKLTELKEASEFADQLNVLETDFTGYLERNGGLAREDNLLSEHARQKHDFDFFHTNAFLFVVDHLFASAGKQSSNDDLHPVWYLKEFDINQVVDLLAEVAKQVESEKKLHSHEEIVRVAEDNLTEDLKASIENYLSKHSQLELKQVLESYLNASTLVEKNILDQWGLAGWENIGPKKLGDKILLIFQKQNEPLHFRDIAEKINEANFDHKNICAATVHNELIANDKYVLIGRGIYALKEWGYKTGTVAEIIESVLRKSDHPMTKDEIYEEVLKQRKVNKSTIYLTLINKDKFEKVGANKFSLRK